MSYKILIFLNFNIFDSKEGNRKLFRQPPFLNKSRMNYYSAMQSLSTKGVFIGYLDGYATFQLENDDMIHFEQIDEKILSVYDFKSNQYKNKFFEIYYTEIFDDLDDEDFIVFRLDDLKLL